MKKCSVVAYKCANFNRKVVQETKAKQNAREIVYIANQWKDPNELVALPIEYTSGGINVTISCFRSKHLEESVIPWVLNLIKDNMQDFYEASESGWDAKLKRRESINRNAIYLLAKVDEALVGFAHFRFTVDDSIPVLYCYELQLEKAVRRIGLGKYLMQTLELIAAKTNMEKVMVTVFKRNIASRAFFTEKLRYELDETSPSSEVKSYEIFSMKIAPSDKSQHVQETVNQS